MKPSEQCEVCRDPLKPDRRDFSHWLSCARCDHAIEKYNAKIDQAGDSNFVYHELAHHVVLYRRVPRRARDWRRIERTIDPMTLGHAQTNELRTLALQFVAYEQLGWRPSIKQLVELSWFGLVDSESKQIGGRSLVETREGAEARVAALVSKVSARNVKMYVNALRELRGETS